MQTAIIHNGYVSECVWARPKMSAHVLFMLSEEAIATALTLSAVCQVAGHRLTFGQPCTVTHGAGTMPRLITRMSIASSGCDSLVPDERTGRLVCPTRLSQHLVLPTLSAVHCQATPVLPRSRVESTLPTAWVNCGCVPRGAPIAPRSAPPRQPG